MRPEDPQDRISNADRDIFSLLDLASDDLTDATVDVQPANRPDESRPNSRGCPAGILCVVYLGVVYKGGFSRDRAEYERHSTTLSETVWQFASDSADDPYLMGDNLTGHDTTLFVCLVRFDGIYVPMFRCTAGRIEDQPALTRSIVRIMDNLGVRETFDLRASMTDTFEFQLDDSRPDSAAAVLVETLGAGPGGRRALHPARQAPRRLDGNLRP